MIQGFRCDINTAYELHDLSMPLKVCQLPSFEIKYPEDALIQYSNIASWQTLNKNTTNKNNLDQANSYFDPSQIVIFSYPYNSNLFHDKNLFSPYKTE